MANFSNEFLNCNTEDLWAIAQGEKRKEFDYYCTSQACCRIVTRIDVKTGYKNYKILEKIKKFTDRAHHSQCPECKSPLIKK